MSKTKYPVIYENENGWSNWLFPVHSGYKMACCDCGLIHNIQFKVCKVSRKRSDGTFLVKKQLKDKTIRVGIRAQRDNRATGQLRRNRHKNNNK